MVDLATWKPTIIVTETDSDGIDRGKSTYSLLNKLLVRNAIQHEDITHSKGLVVAENKRFRMYCSVDYALF